MLSPQWLDELRSRITLSGVIMRTVKLQRAGREWRACCPFHNEKSPSFYVNDEKGFYHCFGCGVHGDAIRWMTDQRGLAFMDAVKELAAQAGMEVPAPDPRVAQRQEAQRSLRDVTEAAALWFQQQLAGADGHAARAYLLRRGISEESVHRFGIGLAPDHRTRLREALGAFPLPMLIESGMLIQPPDDAPASRREPYDRFRGRLMIPIRDPRGRVVAFGGRFLGDGEPKYLNSPDTPLFDKGRLLFNLDQAAPAARETGRLIVVEGYMDVIALAQAGIREAVAPMGTALTEAQIELLWRQVDAPLLCFDGDKAGQRAAMRAALRALPLLRPGHTLQFVHLPPGLDPDDLIKQQGKAAIDAVLAAPHSLLDTLWQHERDAQPLGTPEAKAGLKARLLAHVEAIAHPDIAALYRRELLDRFSAFAFPPRAERPARGQRGGGLPRPAAVALSAEAKGRLRKAATGQRDLLAGAVFAGLLRFPERILVHAGALNRLAERDPALAPTIDSLIEAAEMLEPGATGPILPDAGFAAPPDSNRFTFLREGIDPNVAHDELAEAIALLVERPALEAALAAATARFASDPEGAFAEQQRLLKRKLDFEQRLGQMVSARAARAAISNSARSSNAAAHDSETD